MLRQVCLDGLGVPVDVPVEEIPGGAEAAYEYAAVQYAMAQNGLEMPDSVLAGGNGSVQLSAETGCLRPPA
jgi:hypothetical protein